MRCSRRQGSNFITLFWQREILIGHQGDFIPKCQILNQWHHNTMVFFLKRQHDVTRGNQHAHIYTHFGTSSVETLTLCVHITAVKYTMKSGLNVIFQQQQQIKIQYP